MNKRNLCAAWLRWSVAALALGASAVGAQNLDGKIVVGNQPGGATDIVARLLAPEYAKALGRPFVVENRTGASGNIAAEYVAKAPADGNTILLVFNSHTTISSLFPKLSFDPIKDFASVGLISDSPYLIVARPGIGASTLRELVDKAKREGKPISIGSPGLGTPQHLLAQKLSQEQKVDVSVVHYKGSAPAQTDVMGGHVDITFVTNSLGAAFVKAGKLQLLGITSDQRSADFPATPTTREQGLDLFNGSGVWLALLVPAKTPAAKVDQLNQVLNKALQTPEVQAKLKAVGMTPMGGASAVQDKLMHDEQATWSALIKASKISLD
jgi:tripartite-type tricarboxylate transporter receptor subunit TctC